MVDWLLRTIGVPGEFSDHLDAVVLSIRHPYLLVIGLLTLPILGWWIYRRQRQTLSAASWKLCATLTALRVLMAGLLLLIVADPFLSLDLRRIERPRVGILFDHSQSMFLPSDASDGPTRIALAHDAVDSAAAEFLRPLQERFDVRMHGFGASLQEDAVPPASAARAGSATHLGDAVQQFLQETGGGPVAGVVLFSDGRNTGGRAPLEAARTAANRGVPVFTVPTGDARRLRDLAVADVSAPPLVTIGDAVPVAVTLESHGFEGRSVSVELREGDRVFDRQEVVLREGEQQQLELTFDAKEPGAHYLAVVVPPQPEEPKYLHSNNQGRVFVRVTEEKLRVLLVEGLPRWDFRFLKNAMRRDAGLTGHADSGPDIVLEAEWRRQAQVVQTRALPATEEELAWYHVVILGDASPRLLTPEFLALLGKAVRDRGLGLIVEAGPLSMPHAHGEALLQLLPVRLQPSVPGVVAPVYRPFRLELSPEGATHDAMRFHGAPDRNRDLWNRLPPFYWCAAARRLTPGASALAWTSDADSPDGRQPVIATSLVGKGRTLFIGTDEMWRWRQNAGDRTFYRFWGQAIRHVARREDAERRSWLGVLPLVARPGEGVRLELMAFDSQGKPREEAARAVRVALGQNAGEVELQSDAETPGRYTGQFVPSSAGEFLLTYSDERGVVAEARLLVLDDAEELRRPDLDRPTLEAMARASAGGRIVDIDALGSIPPLLHGEPRELRTHREAGLWDNGITLLVLVGLYALDVGLRRLGGLS